MWDRLLREMLGGGRCQHQASFTTWVLVGKGGRRGSQVGNDKEMAEIILFEKDRYYDPDV